MTCFTRNERRSHRADRRAECGACRTRSLDSLEVRRREVHRAAFAERHGQTANAVRAAPSRPAPSGPGAIIVISSSFICKKSKHAAPLGTFGSRPKRAESARLHRPREHVQIAVDRSAKVLANELRGLEIELPAAQKVDVQRVEPRRVEHAV